MWAKQSIEKRADFLIQFGKKSKNKLKSSGLQNTPNARYFVHSYFEESLCLSTCFPLTLYL